MRMDIQNDGKWSQFTSKRQPTTEQRKKWRVRRKEARRILEKLMEFQEMTLEQLEYMVKTDEWKKLPIKDAMLFKYLHWIFGKNPHLIIDWLNRHISYAPSKTELKTDDSDIDYKAIKKLEDLLSKSKKKGK